MGIGQPDSNRDCKHLGTRESAQNEDPHSQFGPNHDKMRILSIWVESIFSKIGDSKETRILISNQTKIQKLGSGDSRGREFKHMGRGGSAQMMDPMIISAK